MTYRSLKVGLLLATVMLFAPAALAGDGEDFGMLYTLSAQKKFNKKTSLEAELELRTRNDSRTLDRWKVGLDADYKLTNRLKAEVGYQWLYSNNREKITFNPDGNYNNWRPSYWSSKHRLNVSLTGSVKVKRVEFSLRERYQLTYRPEAVTDRYDFDNDRWEETTVRSKTAHMLRSRFKMEWNIAGSKLTPYAAIELFNGIALKKSRYVAGLEYPIRKQHVLGAYYRYQHINQDDDDDNDPNRHYMGVSYKYKF